MVKFYGRRVSWPNEHNLYEETAGPATLADGTGKNPAASNGASNLGYLHQKVCYLLRQVGPLLPEGITQRIRRKLPQGSLSGQCPCRAGGHSGNKTAGHDPCGTVHFPGGADTSAGNKQIVGILGQQAAIGYSIAVSFSIPFLIRFIECGLCSKRCDGM